MPCWSMIYPVYPAFRRLPACMPAFLSACMHACLPCQPVMSPAAYVHMPICHPFPLILPDPCAIQPASPNKNDCTADSTKQNMRVVGARIVLLRRPALQTIASMDARPKPHHPAQHMGNCPWSSAAGRPPIARPRRAMRNRFDPKWSNVHLLVEYQRVKPAR